jgi:hypothetical protein
MAECRGRTLSLPLRSNGVERHGPVRYHQKIADGLLEPHYRDLRPPGWTALKRPSVVEAFERNGWAQPDVDLYEALRGRAGDGWL